MKHFNYLSRTFTVILLLSFFFAAEGKNNNLNLLPMPAKVELTDSTFRLNKNFIVEIKRKPAERLCSVASRVLRRLSGRTGLFFTQDYLCANSEVENPSMIILADHPGKVKLGEDESYTLDIAPSIIAFLNKDYKIQIPSETTFMGSGLDTTRQFRDVHSYPLMRNKNELLDYLYQDYFLSDKILYRIDSDLNLIPSTNQMMKDKIGNLFDEFKQKQNYMMKTMKLIPSQFIF